MNSLFGNWASTLRKSLLLLALSILLPILGISNSVMAAERIYASYSPLEIAFPVSILENYAKTGAINDELSKYQQYLPAPQLQELRRVLLQPVKVSPAVVSQFLYTAQGEFLLRRLAKLIKTPWNQAESGLQTLRSALILATAEPGGLTLLNLLRKYPTSSIHLDLVHSLGIAAELENLISETSRAIALVIKQSNIEADTIPSANVSSLPDLQTEGQFTMDKYHLKFFDSTRDRLLFTDIYVPHVQSPAPVIVISHGLGLDSSNFRYLATHLASHGFTVVVPNHPGSDAKQLQLLLNGSASEVAAPEEFQDRPMDVKYILDQLEESSQSDSRFQNRLNLQQVGVFGQSFGGYTALALAGAEINFQQLKQDCQPESLQDTWNMSLLLQCRALELSAKQSGKELNLRDERVKAAIAVNPMTSSIFGKLGLSQIKTPVMLVGSSEDTVAPALYEQILPFSWFANAHKYLVILVGATHFSTIGNSNPESTQVALPAEMVGDATQARRYINVLSLPFFQSYVAGRLQSSSYLNAAYAKSISSKSLGLSIVQSLSTKELAAVLSDNINATNSARKKSPDIIVRFGFWILDIGVSLLQVTIFL
ncbi:putative dienelactone hydrolase [Cylindrospermum stagnale PCC 7417]|uniref:Putative dienelactone hydrolase n=1 Tax=Cylindrospermum stagnale PCC 7417 TaxID=56107 RepID=K9WWT1_9NOST|nr:alpha/beta hydrolase [Cylindrospermum stagnale]AFZ24835.1 putative dienelactone hydrolase [Cylindrospermum stagnale PCC 7417]